MTSRRSVLFLVWRDTRHPEGGGSEVYVEHMARHLASTGHDVTIFCAAHPAAPADEVVDGVRFVRRGGRLGVYARGLLYLRTRGRHADVVVDVQNGISFFSPLVRRRPVTVLVHHIHREQWQMVYPGWRGRLGWWLESRAAPRVNRGHRYITVSQASADELATLGVDPDAITVVHNGVDLPAPREPLPRSTRPTLCVLARLVPHKRVEHALEAVAKLSVDIRDLRLDVIGDGWWRDHLTARTEELGIEGQVTFHGHVDAGRRDDLLDSSWVMLAPSVKEGWGLAVIEAAAHGVPTVAYAAAGGVRESVVDGVTGHLVDDVEQLVEAARVLLTDHAVRHQMSLAAREHALDFDWDGSAARFAKQILSD